MMHVDTKLKALLVYLNCEEKNYFFKNKTKNPRFIVILFLLN